MPDKKYTKVEEEIIQILDQAERETPRSRLGRRPNRPPRAPRRQRLPEVGTGWLGLGGALALGIVAIIVSQWSHTLAVILAVAAIVVFFVPVVRSIRTPTTTTTTRTWRGRDIDLREGRSGPLDSVRRWLSRGGGS